MSEEVTYITAEGKADMEKELHKLKEFDRPELAQRLKEAVAMGDLKENADYHDTREKMSLLDGRIQYIEEVLRNAQIIENDGSTDEVRLGSTVTIREEGFDEDEVYTIVGAAEAISGLAAGSTAPVELGESVTFFATAAFAQSEYRARAGDTLTIEVLEDNSLNRSVEILPDGRISFPFAGTLQAAGRTVGQIEATITSAIASNFANEPNVFVTVIPGKSPLPKKSTGTGRGRNIDIYMLGEVSAPGLKEVQRGTTLLQAMALSGGLTKFAATKRIQLRSSDPKTGQPVVQTFNYKALTDGAALGQDTKLRDGDVILVPERRLFE